jgi:hypothetical protein
MHEAKFRNGNKSENFVKKVKRTRPFGTHMLVNSKARLNCNVLRVERFYSDFKMLT